MDERVKKEVIEIADSNAGRITADMVLSAAQQAGTALYEYFEKRGVWDPAKAQHAYGLIVARDCIRSCKMKVVTETITIPVPRFVRDPEAERKVQGYIALSRLRNDEDLARDALVNEFARAGAAMKRAQHLAVAVGLEDQVREIRERIEIVAHAAEERMGPAQ